MIFLYLNQSFILVQDKFCILYIIIYRYTIYCIYSIYCNLFKIGYTVHVHIKLQNKSNVYFFTRQVKSKTVSKYFACLIRDLKGKEELHFLSSPSEQRTI